MEKPLTALRNGGACQSKGCGAFNAGKSGDHSSVFECIHPRRRLADEEGGKE